METTPKTYNDLYLETRRLFREQNISAYNLEARILTAYAANKTFDQFMRDRGLYASEDTEAELEALVKRRLQGEPVAYITGIWEFFGFELTVTPDVMIPRIDTELLAKSAVEYLAEKQPDARVLDLCAGSGCLGIAIAGEAPECRVVSVDISEKALDVCRKNIIMNNLSLRITSLKGDVFESAPANIGNFDLIVSNPPYIPSADIDRLDISVKDYEPVIALDGGEDGLKYYRAILSNWKKALRPGGVIMFEVGINQAESVKKLLMMAGFRGVSGATDTISVERVVYGRV